MIITKKCVYFWKAWRFSSKSTLSKKVVVGGENDGIEGHACSALVRSSGGVDVLFL